MDELLTRFVENLVGRVHGPMNARLILQPLMAVIFAARDGRRDAYERRPVYFWSLLTDATHRREMLRGAWKAVGKVFTIALVLDVVYQFITVRWFYPGEALVVAVTLAMVPYLLLRGPTSLLFRGKSNIRP